VSELLDQIEHNLRTLRLLRRSEPVVVAVSGGLDSMVLLFLLHRLAARNGWKLAVAHLNHQLRGRSSDADERLVMETAEQLKLPAICERTDVRAFAGCYGLSTEMAARDLRHDFLARAATHFKSSKIALAHHADDQIELFFLRLLRGSGIEGLSGMKWRSPSSSDPAIELVRPLLDQPKEALRKFAVKEKIPFREDASNASIEIQRNRIRHELLPLLRQHYQPALDKTILRVMEIMRGEGEFVGRVAAEWLCNEIRNPKSEIRRKSEIRNPNRKADPGSSALFSDLPVAVQRRCVQKQLLGLGIAADFSLVEQLRMHADKPVSVGISPRGQTVVRDNKGILHLAPSREPEFHLASQELVLDRDRRVGEVQFAGATIRWQILPGGSRPAVPHPGCEFFDAGRVGGSILLRHWQPGDRFQPIGMDKPVKLQDLFTNQKISRIQRHKLILAVTTSGEVFWVEGLRISERFKLTGLSKLKLRWQWART
jgi:tRNA(Ile)-lysidine synthase